MKKHNEIRIVYVKVLDCLNTVQYELPWEQTCITSFYGVSRIGGCGVIMGVEIIIARVRFVCHDVMVFIIRKC